MKMLWMVIAALPLAACNRSERTASAPTPAAAASAPDDARVPRLAVGTKAVCPVMGEEFTVREDTIQVVYNGKRYAFCCPDCRPKFDQSPAKFATR